MPTPNEIQWLLTERQNLMEKWDQVLKDAMGDARRVKPTTELDASGVPIQKGQSGEEMVNDAQQAVAPELQQLKQRIDEIDATISASGGKIKWFRSAMDFTKPKKQVTKVTTPSKPKAPKVPGPKVKKVYKGPKSPEFYKRKLYVPQPFIHASFGRRAYLGMTFLQGLCDGASRAEITWLETPRPCDKCQLSPNVWGSFAAFESDPNRPRYNGEAIFHGECGCRLRVKLSYPWTDQVRVVTFGLDQNTLDDPDEQLSYKPAETPYPGSLAGKPEVVVETPEEVAPATEQPTAEEDEVEKALKNLW